METFIDWTIDHPFFFIGGLITALILLFILQGYLMQHDPEEMGCRYQPQTGIVVIDGKVGTTTTFVRTCPQPTQED